MYDDDALTRTVELPLPPAYDVDGVVAWVGEHLGDLTLEGPDGVVASPRFRGGWTAAQAALDGFDVTGYASRRNQVLPEEARGASALSPYVRHGLIGLPELWAHVGDGPSADKRKYRDELLWQEYARHVHARLGHRDTEALRFAASRANNRWEQPWPADMACVEEAVDQLETDGWVVNQARMWLSSQWTVRAGHDWREGEARFRTHLLDGSPAANRLGWQWTVGTGTGRPYGFARRAVQRRAPELCGRCVHRDACPIEHYPSADQGERLTPPDLLRGDPDVAATAGPERVVAHDGEPAAVWLTAESLGDDDPALTAHPDLPVVFCFDAPALHRWLLSGKRLVFLAETLADLATRRDVRVLRGDPVTALASGDLASDDLASGGLAVTWAPVPGFRHRSARLPITRLHPWPWLRRPHGGSIGSFSAWRKAGRF